MAYDTPWCGMMAQAGRPERKRRSSLLSRRVGIDVAKFIALVAFLTWVMYRGTGRLGYHWQWHRVPQYFVAFKDGSITPGPLIEGLLMTFQVSAWGLMLAFLFGLVTALLRMSRSLMGAAVARLYLEVIRNTPLLVRLSFPYFVIAPVLGIGRFTSAVLALSLFEGAYASEIFRSGIVSIHKGQWEVAYSLGLSTVHTYRYVSCPRRFAACSLPPARRSRSSRIQLW